MKFTSNVSSWVLRTRSRKVVAGVMTVAAAYVLGLLTYRAVYDWRHPPGREQRIAEMARSRCGDPSVAEHRRILNEAIRKGGALRTLLAIDEEQRAGRAPWERLRAIPATQPSPGLLLKEKATWAFLDGKLEADAAAQFTQSSADFHGFIADVDPERAALFLQNTLELSNEECRNAGSDASYAFIASRIAVKYRQSFRQYQEELTPLLLAADPSEWNGLLAAFEAAQPAAARILRDGNLGQTYGLVYVLNHARVEQLKQLGIPEQTAIEFVGVNARTIEHYGGSNWAEIVKSYLAPNVGPDGKTTLLTWACADPSVYRLLMVDASPAPSPVIKPPRDLIVLPYIMAPGIRIPGQGANANLSALSVLRQYAGTYLPVILIGKYGQSETLLATAIDAICRFDTATDATGKKRERVAASFLSHFQDNPEFKRALGYHGAILIPALSVGGEDYLADIVKNPNNILKHVTPDGQPREKPWWTWVPGGNIVYLGMELWGGLTPTAGEIGWAILDLAVFYGPGARVPLLAGEKAAGRALLKSGVRRVGQAGTRRIALASGKGAGRFAAAETIEMGGRALAIEESKSFLRIAGRKTADVAWNLTKAVARFALEHPGITIGTGLVAYFTLFPDHAKKVLNEIIERLKKPIIEGIIKVLTLPGDLIKGIRDTVIKTVPTPLAPWIYWPLTIVIIGFFYFLVPLWVLKKLAPPLHKLVIDLLRIPVNLLDSLVKLIQRRRRARPTSTITGG